MANLNINAIILNRKNMGEADRLLFAFSRELGKIRIVAKGCRKLKSKMACHIEPFTIGKYYLVKGKLNYILAGAEGVCQNHGLSENIEAYKDASYLCELLDLVTEEEQSNLKLYDQAADILKALTALPPAKRNILLRYFEFLILESSGYKPNYQSCPKCGAKIAEQDEYLGTFEGVVCPNCDSGGREISKNTLKLLRIFESGNLKKITLLNASDEIIHDLSEVILPYLYDILPRKPRSQKL